MGHKQPHAHTVVFGRELDLLDNAWASTQESGEEETMLPPPLELDQVGEMDLLRPGVGAPVTRWGRRDRA
ncbi:MAG TPA: hypothetical protein VF777_13310 [Phycisphaerales bacterium]